MRYKKKGAGMPKGAGNGMYMNGGRMYSTGGAVPGGTGAAPASFWSSAPDASGQHRKHNFAEVEGMPGLFKSTSGDVYMESSDAGKTARGSTLQGYKRAQEEKKRAAAEQEYQRTKNDRSITPHSDRSWLTTGRPGKDKNPANPELKVSYGDAYNRYSTDLLTEYNKMAAAGLSDVPVVDNPVRAERDREWIRRVGNEKLPTGQFNYEPARARRDSQGNVVRANEVGQLLEFLDQGALDQQVMNQRYRRDQQRKEEQRKAQGQKYKNGGRVR
jgi:hypothetical protein